MSSGPTSASMLHANLMTMYSRSSPCPSGIPSISKLYFLVIVQDRHALSLFCGLFLPVIHSSLSFLEVLLPYVTYGFSQYKVGLFLCFHVSLQN